MKRPKDIERFDDSRIAAGKLIKFALERILLSKAKVQWTLTVRHWDDDWMDKSKDDNDPSPVRVVRGTNLPPIRKSE